jgi:hypothetical protein
MNPVIYASIILAAIPSILFPVIYWSTSSWHRSLMGKSIMIHATSIGSVMLLIVLAIVLPDGLWREIARVILYPLIGIGQWAQLVGYLVTRRRAIAEEKKGSM